MRILVLCCVWLALAPVARAQYPECQSGDCQDGTGTLRLAEGNTYTGTFRGGKRHGQGRFVWANGDVYVGTWANDGIQGTGTLTAADGRVYVGQFVNGLMQGQGTFTWPAGHRYAGEWFAGAPHGAGRMRWADGGVYDGIFFEGRPHGTDTVVWGNGSVYIGEIRQGQLHGEGTFTWGPLLGTPGAVFTGRWVHNQRTGPGIISAPDSSCAMTATFANNLAHGTECRAQWRVVPDTGTAVWASYTGGVVAGRWEGLGTYTTWQFGPGGDSIPGRLFHGRWRTGRPDGPGILENLPVALAQPNALATDTGIVPGTLTYIGEWRGGWFEGQGVLKVLDTARTVRETHTGTFFRNQLNGLGSVEWPSGDRFQGLFSASRYQGQGRYTFQNTSYIDGTWRHNTPDDNAQYYNSTAGLRRLPDLAAQVQTPFTVSAAFLFPSLPPFPELLTPPLPEMPSWE